MIGRPSLSRRRIWAPHARWLRLSHGMLGGARGGGRFATTRESEQQRARRAASRSGLLGEGATWAGGAALRKGLSERRTGVDAEMATELWSSEEQRVRRRFPHWPIKR